MKKKENNFQTVIEKNTFYFFSRKFEEEYQGYIDSIKDTLLNLKNEIKISGLKRSIIEDLIKNKENGLRALLSLTGFSNEFFKRIITIIRVVEDKELNELVLKEKWGIKEKESTNGVKEWTDKKIYELINENNYFRKGIVNLFFEGSTIPFLTRTIPLFELKKLSISKLTFEIPEMIDTLIRYKEKGSYSGKKGNNPETIIEEILKELNLKHETGDLTELVNEAHTTKRTMDFIIPNKNMPKIIIESSFLATTSSGQGDKSKTEISIKDLIKKYYPKAKFIGFIDGIGWYVRKGDLMRMVTAYEDVFTFHKDEIKRFKNFLRKEFY